jgi:hypothetical protein
MLTATAGTSMNRSELKQGAGEWLLLIRSLPRFVPQMCGANSAPHLLLIA